MFNQEVYDDAAIKLEKNLNYRRRRIKSEWEKIPQTDLWKKNSFHSLLEKELRVLTDIVYGISTECVSIKNIFKYLKEDEDSHHVKSLLKTNEIYGDGRQMVILKRFYNYQKCFPTIYPILLKYMELIDQHHGSLMWLIKKGEVDPCLTADEFNRFN